MTETLSIDARGRVTLPAKLRKALGDRAVAILTPHGIVLHPVPAHVDLPGPASGVSGEGAALDEV